ncbi:hypothetical protein ABXJ76_03825 [Methylobacter sp. G7]|uniref:hypothetical protein n=1 Tax=Methylobacter sp. G7 TaxID=3230117 RepID=UPI003D8058D3
MISPTLVQLHELSETLPIDINNQDDLKAAFSACSIELINALDEGRIKFSNDLDRATFLALLTVTTDFAMDGRLKTAFTKVTIN